MKKVSYYLALIMVICVFAGCGQSSEKSTNEAKGGNTVSEDAVDTSDEDGDLEGSSDSKENNADSQKDSSSSQKDSGDDEFTYKEAGIGDLKIKLEDIWVYQEGQSGDNSLAFSNGNSILGITCGKQITYQSGKDMANQIKTVYSEYEDYKLLEDINMIKVNGQTWYEVTVSYKEDKEDEEGVVLYERCFGQDYSAYTISFTANASEYDDGIEDAKLAMDTAVVDAEHNDETAAKEMLVGQWGLGNGGLIIFNKDGTYQWFMDAASKDPDYMHEGTYGCDDEIKSMSLGAGQGYYYVCLMPDHFYSGGKEGAMSSYTYHYALTHESGQDDNVFQMVDINSMSMYTAIKLTDDVNAEFESEEKSENADEDSADDKDETKEPADKGKSGKNKD